MDFLTSYNFFAPCAMLLSAEVALVSFVQQASTDDHIDAFLLKELSLVVHVIILLIVFKARILQKMSL